MKALATSLQLRGFELSVFLGWPDVERATAQIVLLDMDIHFAEAPKACLTDQLGDTICYATLLQSLREHVALQSFRLVEYLGRDIYDFTKSQLPPKSRLLISLTKHPDIPGLTGGVCFRYGDQA